MGETLGSGQRRMHIRMPLGIGHALQLAGEARAAQGDGAYTVIPVEYMAGRPFLTGVEGGPLLRTRLKSGQGGYEITYNDIEALATDTARVRDELAASQAALRQRAAAHIGPAAMGTEMVLVAPDGAQQSAQRANAEFGAT